MKPQETKAEKAIRLRKEAERAEDEAAQESFENCLKQYKTELSLLERMFSDIEICGQKFDFEFCNYPSIDEFSTYVEFGLSSKSGNNYWNYTCQYPYDSSKAKLFAYGLPEHNMNGLEVGKIEELFALNAEMLKIVNARFKQYVFNL